MINLIKNPCPSLLMGFVVTYILSENNVWDLQYLILNLMSYLSFLCGRLHM